MNREYVIDEIVGAVTNQNVTLDYPQIEEFLKMLDNDLLKQLYIYFCLKF